MAFITTCFKLISCSSILTSSGRFLSVVSHCILGVTTAVMLMDMRNNLRTTEEDQLKASLHYNVKYIVVESPIEH